MRSVIVRTRLDDEVVHRGKSYRRHASARFVDRPPPDAPREPALGDPWEPLTVRARLHRLNWVMRKSPRVGPASERSCMPDPVREIFKDLPAEPMRLPVPRSDRTAVDETLDSLVRYQDHEDRLIIWAMAIKMSARELGLNLKCHHFTAARRCQEMLAILAADWNRTSRPDAVDIERAGRLIHRNIK